MTDIFISYSRRDIAFARLLFQSLKDNQLEVWIDWERIPVGEDWWKEIEGAIQGADVFMFIISRHSLISEVCKHEIDHALANHKRVIPVIIDDLKAAEVNQFVPELGRINWMIFRREHTFQLEETENESESVALPKQPLFEEALTQLSKTIRIDWDWLRQHTRLQVRALEWERHGNDISYLLHGHDLEDGEAWLTRASGKEQQPTTLQAQYLSSSRAEETRRQKDTLKRQRITLGAILLGLVMAVLLGSVAWDQRNQYLGETHVRATTQAQAEEQARLALSGKLAANALAVQSNQFDLSMLLAVRSYDTVANNQSLQAMSAALNYSPRLAHILPAETKAGMSLLYFGQNATLALSPDGKLLAVVTCTSLDKNALYCSTSEVRLWDTTNWQRVGIGLQSKIGESPVEAVVFSQQGGELVVATVSQRPLRISSWRVTDQTRLASFVPAKESGGQEVSEPVFSLAFSRDGQRIAVGICASYNGNPIEGCQKAEIRLIDLASQQEIATWDVTAKVEGLSITTVPSALAFSPDGALLAYSDSNGKIILLDIVSKQSLGSKVAFGTDTFKPSTLTFSPDGKTLVMAGCGLAGSGTTYCLEGAIYFYNMEKGALSGSALHGHSDSIHVLQYTPDGKHLLSGSYDRNLWLWDPVKRQPLGSALRGHNAAVAGIAVSAGGERAYSLDRNGQVIAWDLGDAIGLVGPVFENSAANRPETLLAVSPDGGQVAAANGLGQIQVWDAQTGRQVMLPLKTTDTYMNALAFSADGKALFSSGRAHPLERWQLGSGSSTTLITNLAETGLLARSIPGSRLVAYWNNSEQTLLLLDTATGQPVRDRVTSTNLPGKTLASIPDGSLLAIGGCVQPGKTGKDCTQGEIRLVHLPDWTVVGEPLRGHAGAVNALVLGEDGKTLVSSAYDGSLMVWALGSGSPPRPIDLSPSGLKTGQYFSQLTLSQDGRLLAGSSSFPLVTTFFETTTGKYLGKVELQNGSTANTMAFSPDGKLFATGGAGGVFYLVSKVSTGQPVLQTIKDKAYNAVAFSPNGKMLATGGISLVLWTVEGESIQRSQTLEGYGRDINSLAYTKDGQTLIVVYDDYTIELWDIGTGTLRSRPYFGALFRFNAPAFSPDGKLLAAGVCVKRQGSNVCLLSEIHFWNTASGIESGQPILQAVPAKIDALVFSRDGNMLATAHCLDDLTGANATNLCTHSEVRLWDVGARKSIGSSLAGLTYTAARLAFSPDGLILAGSDSKQVILWELPSGKQRGAPTSLSSANGLAWRPDSSLLVVGMGNGVSLVDPQNGRILSQSTQTAARDVIFDPVGEKLFTLTGAIQFDPLVWRTRLCTKAGRDMNEAEWSTYLPGQTYQGTCK